MLLRWTTTEHAGVNVVADPDEVPRISWKPLSDGLRGLSTAEHLHTIEVPLPNSVIKVMTLFFCATGASFFPHRPHHSDFFGKGSGSCYIISNPAFQNLVSTTGGVQPSVGA